MGVSLAMSAEREIISKLPENTKQKRNCQDSYLCFINHSLLFRIVYFGNCLTPLPPPPKIYWSTKEVA